MIRLGGRVKCATWISSRTIRRAEQAKHASRRCRSEKTWTYSNQGTREYCHRAESRSMVRSVRVCPGEVMQQPGIRTAAVLRYVQGRGFAGLPFIQAIGLSLTRSRSRTRFRTRALAGLGPDRVALRAGCMNTHAKSRRRAAPRRLWCATTPSLKAAHAGAHARRCAPATWMLAF